MSPRPDAIGLKVAVKSIDDVDPILHELAWLENERARIDAIVRERIDAITKEFESKYVVTIDGKSIPFGERADKLTEVLGDWLIENGKSILTGKKKSIDLAHGVVGLRQIPMVVKLGEDTSEEKALDAIDEEADGIITTLRGWGVKKLKSLGCLVQDVITIKPSLNLAGIKKALENKRLTKEQITTLGLTIREASDDPVVKPNQLVVSNE